jgi:hypothetical protein
LKNGIFIEKTIRARFQKLLDLIWNAIIEAEVNREIEHTARRRESTEALRSNGENMEATRKVWSEGRNVIVYVLKFGILIRRVRIPPGQSADPQAGSEPCSRTGNCPVDA